MRPAEVIERLEPALTKDGEGRYCLLCKKASVIVRLRGGGIALRFMARDRIAFRFDNQGLTVEENESHAVKRRLPWDDIECLMAGEPETDNSTLFQG